MTASDTPRRFQPTTTGCMVIDSGGGYVSFPEFAELQSSFEDAVTAREEAERQRDEWKFSADMMRKMQPLPEIREDAALISQRDEYKEKYLLATADHARLCDLVYEDDGETLKQDTLATALKEIRKGQQPCDYALWHATEKRLVGIANDALAAMSTPEYECKACGATADANGVVIHGNGCYVEPAATMEEWPSGKTAVIDGRVTVTPTDLPCGTRCLCPHCCRDGGCMREREPALGS